MKKTILLIACAVLVSIGLISCGNKGNEKKTETAEENTEVVETEVVEEEDGGSNLAKAAIAELKDLVKEAESLAAMSEEERAKLSQDEAMERGLGFLGAMFEFDKKYGELEEKDFTPRQWKKFQELQDRLEELMKE